MSNMVERLRTLARERGSDTALIAVGASGETRLDYAELDAATRALAAVLQSRFAPGERALLLLSNDQHYVIGFMACLYAGLVAVPVFPPVSARVQHLQRLVAIAADCEAACVLSSSAILGMVGSGMDGFGQATVLTVDVVDAALAASWRERQPRDSEIAFLQYTSGSTSTPKGVMVSHGNLIANERAIQEGMGVGPDDVFGSWLPLYHDMGLIGGLLQPLHQGIPAVLMSPGYFLENPVRWLEAISRHGVTVSGAPDFAFRLCVERVSEAQCAGLDLSRWRLAFSGAEPVRHDTLADFAARFASVGFRASAVYPCYGLAEATLFVTGGRRDEGMHTQAFAASSLAVGQPVVDARGTVLVSCGRVASDHELAIVEPETLARLGDGLIGEIWSAGPSVAQGYWRRHEASVETFVERDGQRWLRTGDLGFTHEGNLYIAGRRKDVIILRGQNIYPQDIERAIEAEVEVVRKGRIAAFAVPAADGSEGVGVAVEVSPGLHKLVPAATLVEALSQAVSAVCHEPLSVALLLNPGALPKTSSGKLQRGACRQGWRERSLDVFGIYEHGRFVVGDGAVADVAMAEPLDEVERELAAIWQSVLSKGVPRPDAQALGRDAHFFVQGGNSLGAVQVAAHVAERWSIAFTVQAMFAHPRLAACAHEIKRLLGDGQARPLTAIVALPAAQRMGPLPVSLSQRGMWLTWALDPSSPAYNIATRLSLQGPLDEAALRQSLAELVARHEPLRTVFIVGADGEPRQHIQLGGGFEMDVVDLRGTADAEQTARADAVRVASAPFDLGQDLPFRATLIRVQDEAHVLVLVAHHIAADGWSLQVAVSELSDAYEAHVAGRAVAWPALSIGFADHAVWQREALKGGELARQLGYWRERLGHEHPALDLPLSRPRSASGVGASVHASAGVFKHDWPEGLSAQLHGLARAQGVTLYMVMLALLKLALYRVTGQNVLRIGAPIANRDRAQTHGLIGYLVTVQVLQTRLDASQRFGHLLEQVKEAVVGAQAHANVPFDMLVEALQPERQPGVHPLFQVKCTQHPGLADGTSFGGLHMALDALHVGPAHFDLSFDFTDHADGVRGVWVYDAAVLDEPTVRSLAESLPYLAAQCLRQPQALLADIDMPGPVSRLQGPSLNVASSDVLSLWTQSVARHPARCAIRHEDEAWTYAQLDRQADRMAMQLQAHGVHTDVRVGLHAGRSCEFVLGLLAVLKAGGVCVPLDPVLPAERLGHQLTDSSAGLLLYAHGDVPPWAGHVPVLNLAFQHDLPNVPDAEASGVVNEPRHPSQAAYVIYTSGSTGQPKGVVVSRGALSNYVQGVLSRLALPDDVDSMAMVSTVAADLGHTSLFGALCSGRSLHLISQERAFDPDGLAQYMAQHRVDVLKIVPSHLQALLHASDPGRVLPHHTLILGGEATSWALLDQVKALRPACRVINHYGPTETTVGVLTQEAAQAHRDAQTLPIGQPLPNGMAWVLDADLNAVAQGVAGELYLGGNGVAQGYQGQPRLTADRFVPMPGGLQGERLYRTGDRVRQLADGALLFLGRVDDQVKIRGYRVEPREVAVALLGLDGVREAEVLARPSDDGRMQLCAYVVPQAGAHVDAAALQASMAGLLPDYMVPSAVVELASMPLNANGKVDRKALPLPTSVTDQAMHELPVGAVEEALATIWQDLLGVAQVNRHDHFFELGGDSILGLKLVARARKVGIRLLAKQIFAHPTVAGLASVAADKAAAKPDGAIPVLPATVRAQGVRASHAQQRQWFLWQLAPHSSAYHIAGGLRLTGAMDVAAMRSAFNGLLGRHESLRTVFRADDDGAAHQVIQPAHDMHIPLIDLSSLHGEARRQRLDEEARQQAEAPFDLTTGPLLRVAFIRLAADDHLLTIVMHHIVSDGWSMQLIMQELAELYAAGVQQRAAKLAPIPVQYADYAVWQHTWLEAGEKARQLAYWRGQLGTVHPVLQLPLDHPRTVALDHPAERHAFALPAALADAVKQAAQAEGVTTFVVLLAAFQTLLYRYTGQQDLRVGTFVANRSRPETAQAVGFFVNTQVLTGQVHGQMAFRALLAQARDTVAGAQAHEDLPFELLLDALRMELGSARNPLFQVMINHQRKDYDSLTQLPGLTLQAPAPGQAQRSQFELTGHALRSQFELTLETVEHPDGRLSGTLTYATDLLKPETVQRMAAHFQVLLGEGAQHPERTIGEMNLLTQAEHAQWLGAWAGEAGQPVQTLVHERIAQQAQARPDGVAVICGDQHYTYAELNARANQLAHHLLAQGMQRDALIGVCMDRSWRMVVALLGVLKAGAAYVPLDPSYPKDRLAYMLEDASAAIVLTDTTLADRLPTGLAQVLCMDQMDAVLNAQPISETSVAVHPDHLVYCIYTSGSTGRPKGAVNTHGGFANLLDWYLSDRLDGDAKPRVLLASSPSFDLTQKNIFAPLAGGGTLIVPAGDSLSMAAVIEAIAQHHPDRINCAPSVYRLLHDAAVASASVKTVVLGGEPIDAELMRQVAHSGMALVNSYGPTECADVAISFVKHADDARTDMPIGQAIPQARIHILDGHLNPVPIGVAGEIHIGGVGVARGYWQRPGQTAEKYIADPFSDDGARLYRTGDLGRWLPDGQIAFLGRIDHQVKVRGMRIELGEIEAELLNLPGIKEAVVLAREGAGADTLLVAYVSLHDGVELGARSLRDELRTMLPGHMVPNGVVALPAMPLSPNGKLDRKALPDWQPAIGLVTAPPQGEHEQAVAEIWSTVLGIALPGRHDNFFELGGSSMSVLEVQIKVHKRMGIQLPVRHYFEHPTLSAISALLQAESNKQAQASTELDAMDALLASLGN